MHCCTAQLFAGTAVGRRRRPFARFAALPNARCVQASGTHERFVYVPGTRKDRVLLAAHADTAWDKIYTGKDAAPQAIVRDGAILRGQEPSLGIGADDRAGCAMLWLLRDSGHSLLILDGEEHGKGAHNLLRARHGDLLAALNRHRYMLEPDLPGDTQYIPARIPSSKRFLRDMETALQITPMREYATAGTDITQFSRRICGICVSCGYQKEHRPEESLDTEAWYAMLCKLDAHLAKAQKRYPLPLGIRLRRFASQCKGKLLRACGK